MAHRALSTGERDTTSLSIWQSTCCGRHRNGTSISFGLERQVGSSPPRLALICANSDWSERVRFVGHQNNYLEYFAMFDALCLTSREDPFPLVVLECAALGKPVLCFADSGGTSEFIEDDCGTIVPYLDIQAMAADVVQLIDNPTLKKKLGLRGEAKVRQRHDVEIVGPRILEIIERCIASRRNDPARRAG